jgi:hypothetical protein
MTALIVGVLDPAIVLLKWLRKAAGAREADDGEDDRKSRRDRPGGRPDDAGAPAAESAPPRPKRRLRAFLVYVSVMLLCGMGGGALAFELLEKLIFYQLAENRRLGTELVAQSKATDGVRKQLEQAQAARIDAQQKLTALSVQAASGRLAGAVTEKPDKPAEARPGNPVARDSASRKAAPDEPGDCRVAAGNDVSKLMDCIHKFNR